MRRLLEAVAPARMGSPFRWLLAATWTSNLGEGLALAAGPLLVARLAGSPFLVALAATLQWLPPLVETATHLALALTTTPWVAYIVFGVFGAHAFVWGTTSITVRQRAVPLELQGRVSSVNTVATFGGLVLGSVIGGVLAEALGVVAPFWFAFGGSVVLVVVLWGQLAHIAHADTDAGRPSS